MSLLFETETRIPESRGSQAFETLRCRPALRRKLAQRLLEKRRNIRAILQGAGIELAEIVSVAPEASMRAFVAAAQRGDRASGQLVELANALGVAPFRLLTSLSVEVNERQGWLLAIELHGFDALQCALTLIDVQLESDDLDSER
jgi:hypothetical protein